MSAALGVPYSEKPGEEWDHPPGLQIVPPPFDPIPKHPDAENAHAFTGDTTRRNFIRNQADFVPRKPITVDMVWGREEN